MNYNIYFDLIKLLYTFLSNVFFPIQKTNNFPNFI